MGAMTSDGRHGIAQTLTAMQTPLVGLLAVQSFASDNAT